MAENKLTYADITIAAEEAGRKAIRAHITTMLRLRRLRLSLASVRTQRFHTRARTNADATAGSGKRESE
jgi:hypothetical protein